MSGFAAESVATPRRRSASRVALAAAVLVACLLLSGCGAEVPDVKGLSLPQATVAPADAGFSAGRVSHGESRTAMIGVIWQAPAAEERGTWGASSS